MTGKAINKGPNDQPILEIDGLSKWFPINNAWKRRIGWLKALDDVSMTVRKGEIIGIVGESGCGKSTLGKTIMESTRRQMARWSLRVRRSVV